MKHREDHRKEWREDHYRTADQNTKLIINLRDLSHTMRSLYEGKGSQKRVLIVLNELGGSTTQRELTERLGIQPGSASEVIAKLESAGHIKRTPNESDRRTADIVLTAQGEILASELRDHRNRRHEQMFSCLTGEEKDRLLELLEKVNADWRERYRDSHEGPCENKGQCGDHGHRHHGRSGRRD